MAAQAHALPKGEYPQTWDEYIGQDIAKNQLRTAAESARILRKPAEHVLLSCGRGGVGKSALALLYAKQIGVRVHVVSGAVRLTEARSIFAKMRNNDVLLYDEVHKVVDGGKQHGEWLLHVMQDGVLVTPYGTRAIPKVTIVGATTDAGKLPQTILRRFTLKPPIKASYSNTEAARIVEVIAHKVLGRRLPPPSPANHQALARGAGNNPGEIANLLKAIRILATTKSISHGNDGYDLNALWSWAGITPDGLDHQAQDYLRTMLRVFNGGPAGERAISNQMTESAGVNRSEVRLVELSFLVRSPRGRSLTAAGMNRAKELEAADQAA